jgi:hypothetical protein
LDPLIKSQLLYAMCPNRGSEGYALPAIPRQDATAKTRRRAPTTHPIGGPSAELAPLNGFAHDRALAAIRRASS